MLFNIGGGQFPCNFCFEAVIEGVEDMQEEEYNLKQKEANTKLQS